MRVQATLGVTASISLWTDRASAFGLSSYQLECPRHARSSGGTRRNDNCKTTMGHARSARRRKLQARSLFDGAEPRDARGNPLYRKVIAIALRSAADGVQRYFPPSDTRDAREDSSTAGNVGRDSSGQSEALHSQLGPLLEIVLSSSPNKEIAQAVTAFLDRCQEESGTGATLALALLDTGWSLPAIIRPKLGDWVFSALFEALRRYGVFTRYGALQAPDKPAPYTEEDPQKYRANVVDTPVFKALEFGTNAKSASIGLLMAGFFFFMYSSISGDLKMTSYAFIFMGALILEREILSGALVDELVNSLQPKLTDFSSVHEAGHIVLSYLAGCPVSNYSLGGLSSLRHGGTFGSRPSCTVVDPELTVARESFPDEALSWTGRPSVPSSTEAVAREEALRQRARQMLTCRNEPGGSDAVAADESTTEQTSAAPGRFATANRFALSAMGGAVTETMVHDVGMGARQDQMDLFLTMTSLWPTISVAEIENTRKWAVTVGLDVLRDDQDAVELLAKNMRETREIGRLFLDLEKSLTKSEYSCEIVDRSSR